MAKTECLKCGVTFASPKGVIIHQHRKPNCDGTAESKPVKRRKKRVNYEHEYLALQVRCELAAKILMGAI